MNSQKLHLALISLQRTLERLTAALQAFLLDLSHVLTLTLPMPRLMPDITLTGLIAGRLYRLRTQVYSYKRKQQRYFRAKIWL